MPHLSVPRKRGCLMTRLIGVLLAIALVACAGRPVRSADAADANAVIDKAVQALGGADKLGKAKAISWTVKGTITFQGNDNPVTIRQTAQGLDHARQEFEGEF